MPARLLTHTYFGAAFSKRLKSDARVGAGKTKTYLSDDHKQDLSQESPFPLGE